MEELLRRHARAGTGPGAIGLLGADEPEVVAVGVAAVGGPALRCDAIVRIRSMTKAVTAVAALRLVEAGWIWLDDSLEDRLPRAEDYGDVAPTGWARTSCACAVGDTMLRTSTKDASLSAAVHGRGTPRRVALIMAKGPARGRPQSTGTVAWSRPSTPTPGPAPTES